MMTEDDQFQEMGRFKIKKHANMGWVEIRICDCCVLFNRTKLEQLRDDINVLLAEFDAERGKVQGNERK
jgi:hypothetical protein